MSLVSIVAFSITSFVVAFLKRRHRRPSSRSRLVRYLSTNAKWESYGDDDEFFIQNLPKAELHIHLDGTFDPDFLWKYMREHPESVYCLPVSTTPPWEDPPKQLKVREMVEECKTSKDFHELCTCRGYRSLKQMLNCFELFLPLVRGNLQLIEQLAFDFCQRQFEQNAVYTEVRYSPHLLAEDIAPGGDAKQPTVSADDIYMSVTKGLRLGCKTFKITVNQILCAITWRPDWADSTLELAVKYRNSGPCAVVGVDIASGEEHFDALNFPDLFAPHFVMAKKAREKQIPLTIHAGEMTTEVARENVRRAVIEYGAKRIGHGYQMAADESIMEVVKENDVHVEICPTSSVETGGWTYKVRDWSKHPIRTMMEHGLSVSLSSDDPAVFHTSLAWQYRIALAKMKCSRSAVIKMNLDAIDAAFCSDEEKAKFRTGLLSFVEDYHLEGLEKDFKKFQNVGERPASSLSLKATESFSDRVYINSQEYI